MVGGQPGLDPFSVPDGTKKTDEFFGEVETYRTSLTLTQSLPELPTGNDSVQLEVKFQGCADIGICYPPQRTRVTIDLPSGVEVHAAAPQAWPNGSPKVSGLSLGLPGHAGALTDSPQDALPDPVGRRCQPVPAGVRVVQTDKLYAPNHRLEPGVQLGHRPHEGRALDGGHQDGAHQQRVQQPAASRS